MKNRIEKIVVILFVFAMCLLMSISAHAGNSYFFGSEMNPRIELDGVTITPSKSVPTNSRPRIVFNEDVTYYARVCSGSNADNLDTQFNITTSNAGVLLVYYARPWEDGATVNDAKDLNIIGCNGFAEYTQTQTTFIEGVKYFVLSANSTYTLTAQTRCGVYGFVYMSGNVGAYNPKGKGDFSLIGQCYTGDYNNLQMPSEDDWYFEGWYKDDAFTQKVMPNTVINEPTVLFAHWARCVWDFENYAFPSSSVSLANTNIEYDGIMIYGSDEEASVYGRMSAINNASGLTLYRQGTKFQDCVEFTPMYDGDLMLTYKTTGSMNPEQKRWCVVGTDVVDNLEDEENKTKVVACGYANLDGEVRKKLHAKLRRGTKYYIYQIGLGIGILEMKYTASASSADVDGNSVTLTTTANMQGWRAFYDKENSYTVDENTNVYIAVSVEDGDENDNTQTVKFINKTGKKVPIGCAVVLHSDAVQADGTYLITMTKDAEPYGYDGDNLLRHSEAGFAVDAYRLGYRSGEGNGVAFYSWKADNPSEGIVYLEQPSNSAKIAFEIEDAPTGIASVHNEQDKNNQYFNLNGQRLAAPQKGFNIINGKKCIVR